MNPLTLYPHEVIRLLSTGSVTILAKMEFNESRPERHGGKVY